MDEGGPHIDATRARGGQSNHMTRVILPVGLALVIIAFLILLFVAR